MRKRYLFWLSVVLSLLLIVPSLAQAKGGKPVPDPVRVSTGDVSIMAGTPGTWYVGATPPNVDYSKPVLLFVHGKGSSASTWWTDTAYHGVNDMYTYAYNNGYRTAFVDLYPDKNMWDNGYMLNGLIDRITAYFGVSKVTIIAHSKGGVDSNAASVHYGSAPKISRVVTLGTPHWGTPLADMAYSTWTWWLAAIFGQRDDATYSMQTGYMNSFRSMTDYKDPSVPYYTLSGYKCGPVGTAMWYGCMAISGEDDGVVPVWSARKPGGTHLKEGYWDHDEIKMGSRTWSYFSPVIQTASLASPAVASEGALLAAASLPDTGLGARPQAPGNLILRGGDTTANPAPAFPVESGVRSATFTFYASSRDFTATLIGPDGAKYAVAMSGQVPAEEVFSGTWTGSLTLPAPAAGQWQISAAAPSQAGFLMTAALDADLQGSLDVGQQVSAPGATRQISAGSSGRALTSTKAEAAISFSGRQPFAKVALPAAAAGKGHTGAVQLTAEQGILNVTATLTGTTADGFAFERTLVSSFAVR